MTQQQDDKAAALRRYAEAIADAHMCGKALAIADPLRPAGATDAELTAAMMVIAGELAANPHDTKAVEAVLRGGESARVKDRDARKASRDKVLAWLQAAGLSVDEVRAVLG